MKSFERIERALGVLWDIEDLVGDLDSEEEKKKKAAAKKKEPEKLSRKVRIPALAALAPEMIKALGDEYRRKVVAAMKVAANVPKGHKLVEVGTLSAEEAKALLLKLAPAATPDPE